MARHTKQIGNCLEKYFFMNLPINLNYILIYKNILAYFLRGVKGKKLVREVAISPGPILE
jgi:hypothetical protein